MIDVHLKILAYLESVSAVTDLATGGIYAARDVPPETYLLSDGSALVFRVRGGDEDYGGAILTPSVQFKCYGATEADADSLYRAVNDALHGVGLFNGDILQGEREAQGQPLEEPDTRWPYVLAYYTLMIRSN
jgi:hypothetical protein